MNSHLIFERPFSSWSLEPAIGEPSYGYFGRQVSNEGHFSNRIYATEIGLNGRRLHPEELLKSLMKLDLRAEFKERLQRFTPLEQGSKVWIGNNVLRGKQFSYAIRRFCPACLAEHAFHRVWWDIIAFERCPLHDQPLQTETCLGETLRWWWSGVDVSPKGEDLAIRKPTNQLPQWTLEAFIIQRIVDAPRVEPMLLAGQTLADVLDVVTSLAQLLTRRAGGQVCTIHQVFEAISAGQPALLDMLRSWLLENFDAEERRKGYNHIFGHSLPFPPSSKESPLYHRVVLTMREAVAETDRFNRYSGRVLAHKRDHRSLPQMVVELGIPKGGVKRLAHHLGLNVGRYSYYFDAPSRKLMQAAMSDLITLPETRAVTGLPPHEFSKIAAAGFIKPLTGVRGGGPTGKRFIRREVERLVEEGLKGLETAKGEDDLTLEAYARRTGQRPSDVVVAILKGRFRATGVRPDRTGFSRICFTRDLLPASPEVKAEKPSSRAWMTYCEVAVASGMVFASVPALVRVGLLEVDNEDATRPLVSRSSFERFRANYANAQIYLDQLGCSFNWVPQEVKKRGIEFAFERIPVERTDTIVLRASAKQALRYDIEPDDPSVASMALWEEFKASVRLACPAFFVQDVFHNGVAKVRPAQNRVFLTARRLDASQFSLEVGFTRKTDGRRWRVFEAAMTEIQNRLPWVSWDTASAREARGVMLVKGSDDISKAMEFLHVLHSHFLK